MSKNRSELGVSRRRFIGGLGAGGLAIGASSLLAACGVKGSDDSGGSGGDELRIGFVSPRTGEAAGFGESDPYVLDLVRDALKDGLDSNGSHFSVRVLDKDGQSDPARAAQVAQDLINSDRVDLMLTTSTPEVVNPVADACEAAGVPCLSTIAPWESFYFARGGTEDKGFTFTYHFSFGTDEFARTYISQWNGPVETNREVGAMWPNDADGNALREALTPALTDAGFTIVDPGPYEDGTNDYSAQIGQFKSENCEIFTTAPLPPDFATFWRQAAQQGYVPKIAQIAKTGVFPSQVEALGDIGVNLAGATFWSPTFPYTSSLTGVSSRELSDGYQGDTGRQWTQSLGSTLALFDCAAEAVRSAGDAKDKRALADALGKLRVDTLLGRIDFTNGPFPNVATAPIIGGQWVEATDGPFPLDFVITENVTDPNVPIAADLKPYR